jgi:hypothetical protein
MVFGICSTFYSLKACPKLPKVKNVIASAWKPAKRHSWACICHSKAFIESMRTWRGTRSGETSEHPREIAERYYAQKQHCNHDNQGQIICYGMLLVERRTLHRNKAAKSWRERLMVLAGAGFMQATPRSASSSQWPGTLTSEDFAI